ncbi:ABC transporter permease subunit [Falsochrobactrum sp. TDYN1]|uniref:ABC transporter permease subunit n=1 Tax=Falsochrobactrum tianjinense TaxID=2706015 RepID=A0A949UUY7_9HYPH|nr:ABC transporter permease subunit [Falsochrobactrum sp. TDYN1]MBV2143791.1 ABC transporter permease subunit [Falsochrobactrum sp. TDYN1]
MVYFVLRRLISAAPTLFVVVTASFFLMRFAPGGPFSLERPLPPEVMANLMKTYNLDQPLWHQYIHYVGNALKGDFGPSFVYKGQSVFELLTSGLFYSFILGIWALLIGVLAGVAIGIVAALNHNKLPDYGAMTVSTIGITIPNFVIGPLLILLFSIYLGWLPAGGWGSGGAANLLLPIITLALPQIAIYARLVRGAMIEALHSDHIRTLKAYGLPKFIIVVVHALRGAMLPAVSYMGPSAAALLTGSVVVETIYSVPGIGRYFVIGALNRDYTLVMGTVILIATLVIIFNLLIDVLYGVLDPRVRYD